MINTRWKLLTLISSIPLNRGWSEEGKRETGFTLVELIVVVVMVGILAAIAAPSWSNFVNQRRVSAVNDAVFQALQEAKSKSQQEKLPYSVSFRRSPEGVLQIAIHPASLNPSSTDTGDRTRMDSLWREGDLRRELGLKVGQVLVKTNIDGTNVNPNQVNAAGTLNPLPLATAGTPSSTTNVPRITFDHEGVLLPDPTPNLGNNPDSPVGGLAIVVAIPDRTGNNDNFAQGSLAGRRCIQIKTLLGTPSIGRGNECPAS